MNLLHFSEIIPGGWNFSCTLGRGMAIRLTDLDGRANASLLAFNAREPHEKYNMPDTLKAQFIAAIGLGTVLYSDMGRILLSVIQDDLGRHDTLTGYSTPETNLRKYGSRTYAVARNQYIRDGRTSLLVELGKYNLGLSHLGPTVNFFTAIRTGEDGTFSFDPDFRRTGASVTLRAEMDTLVVLNTCPHPLDPDPEYRPGRVQVEVFPAPPTSITDPCFQTPQNRRGLENTRRYLITTGITTGGLS